MARSSGQTKTLSDEAMKLLLAYDWPGNVRELENCLERAWTVNSDLVLRPTDLPSGLSSAPAFAAMGSNAVSGDVLPMEELERQAILRTIDQVNGDKLAAARLLGIGKTTLYRKLKQYSSGV
jgi:two-component system response regulator HydG